MEFLLLALSSFWLGALHALEPGHGKTVVGAYLIGSKGRVSDAVLLGLTVTVTHTGVVILLAVLSAMAAAYFVPETVNQVLEVVSGLLVVAVGVYMIWLRGRQARRPAAAAADAHSHDEHTHSHDHAHGEDGHTHSHEDHAHSHDDHAHVEEGHSHSFGGQHHHHVPQLAPGQRPTLWQLLALGISGGLVPCPAALAVLLAAVAYGSYARGIGLVLIFSLGMACTLVAIGLAMLKAASFASRYVADSKWARVTPLVSALLITLVGVGLTVKAVLDLSG